MFQVKSFQEILQRMIDWITSHTTKITDFNEGSATRTLLESIAWTIKDIVSDFFIAFRTSLKNFIYESFGFGAKEALKAGGVVKFTAVTAPTSDIVIPVNTIVETNDGIGFVTTEEGVLLTGQVITDSIPVRAQVEGSSGNVSAFTIINIVTSISGIDGVTNLTPTTGGQDAESEDDQRERFQRYATNLARCTKVGIESGAETVAGVKQAQLTLTATPGLLYLYVDDGTGSAPSGLLDDVKFVIEGDDTPENPGYRAAGTSIEYYSAVREGVTITQTVTIRAGSDSAAVKAAFEAKQTEYVDSHRMGEDLIVESLQAKVFLVPEVLDISMSAPAANIPVADGHVVKIDTINTTIVEA